MLSYIIAELFESVPSSSYASSCTEAGLLSAVAMLHGGGAQAYLDEQAVRYWLLDRPRAWRASVDRGVLAPVKAAAEDRFHDQVIGR